MKNLKRIWFTFTLILMIIAGLMAGNSFARSDSTTIIATADDEFKLYLNGKLILEGSEWLSPPKPVAVKLSSGDVLAVKGIDKGYKAGFLLSAKGKYAFVSNTSWKMYIGKELPGWNTKGFKDDSWVNAVSYGSYGVDPWKKKVKGFTDKKAEWIWSKNNITASKDIDPVVYFRKTIK